VTATGTASLSGGRWEFRLAGQSEPYAASERAGLPTGDVRLRLKFAAAGGVEVEQVR
jgi:hypothetical protein